MLDTFIFALLLFSFANREEMHKNKLCILYNLSLDYF